MDIFDEQRDLYALKQLVNLDICTKKADADVMDNDSSQSKSNLTNFFRTRSSIYVRQSCSIKCWC
ncbi:uncharacterized protein B0P05DRAFT_473689 [Gilbertella persicaria]|uniref:uncharacterized protein n=1 Tax=Gilbertella persicaria TaxID=101096 RepID=UPI002220450A|nr:uncharacterized protein B0P05DRAFT_473689 [Gilbertella persicaria]KAI8072139.1 hypothetical protein B0P05DRAFT_473689 [Gilbertella persicaria]